jgi:hypothetical protein
LFETEETCGALADKEEKPFFQGTSEAQVNQANRGLGV